MILMPSPMLQLVKPGMVCTEMKIVVVQRVEMSGMVMGVGVAVPGVGVAVAVAEQENTSMVGELAAGWLSVVPAAETDNSRL